MTKRASILSLSIAAFGAMMGAALVLASDSVAVGNPPQASRVERFAPLTSVIRRMGKHRLSLGTALSELRSIAGEGGVPVSAAAPRSVAAAEATPAIPAPAVYVGPKMGPYVRNNSHFIDTGNLIRDPGFSRIDAGDRTKFQEEFTERSLERDSLMPQGDALDARERAIVDVHNSHRAELIEILAGMGRFEAAFSEYEVRCDSPANEAARRQCSTDADRLDRVQAEGQSRVARFDAALPGIESERKAFKVAWDAFGVVAGAWARKAASLFERIRSAFARGHERCTYVSRGTNGLCIYTCERRGITNWPANQFDECPKVIYIPQLGDVSAAIEAMR